MKPDLWLKYQLSSCLGGKTGYLTSYESEPLWIIKLIYMSNMILIFMILAFFVLGIKNLIAAHDATCWCIINVQM